MSTIADAIGPAPGQRQGQGQPPDPASMPLRRLREDLDLYPGPRTAEGAATWTLHDPVRDKYFRFGWLEFELLRRWGAGSRGELVERVNRETPLHATLANVAALDMFLDQNQLLLRGDPQGVKRLLSLREGMKNAKSRMRLQRFMFFRFPLFKPDRFLSRTLPYVRFVFTRGFAMTVVALGVIGLALASRQWESFSNSFAYLLTVSGMVTFGIAVFFTKAIHELGHAYTAKNLGLRVPTLGIALLVFFPVFYTDTTHSWRLRTHRQRLTIGIAGVTAELALAAIATFAWNFIPDGALRSVVFFIAAVSWVLTLLVNLNPFLRWDGYYVLSDLWGIENLQQRAFNLGKWRLREWLWGFGDPPPEYFPERRERMLIVYAYATWGYRLLLFTSIAVVAYHFFFKAVGLVLLFLVLQAFILNPIAKEVTLWWRRRREVPLRRALINSLIPVSLIALLFIPWSSTIDAAALLKPYKYSRLYVPSPAQVKQVDVKNGQQVKMGQPIVVLDSPALVYQLQQNRLQVDKLQSQLSRQGAHNAYLERRHVFEQQLAEAMATLAGTQAELEKLVLRAPYDGTVVDVAEHLTPGRWLPANKLLAVVLDDSRTEVLGYVAESDLRRIGIGTAGRFYADEPEYGSIDLQVVEIDRANLKVLDEPYNAAVFGGSIAVQQSGQELVPLDAIYRVRLQAADEQPIQLPRVMRGEVRLEAESVSAIERLWNAVSAVAIRESGF